MSFFLFWGDRSPASSGQERRSAANIVVGSKFRSVIQTCFFQKYQPCKGGRPNFSFFKYLVVSVNYWSTLKKRVYLQHLNEMKRSSYAYCFQ